MADRTFSMDRLFSSITTDLDNKLLADTRWSGLTANSLTAARDSSNDSSQSSLPPIVTSSFLSQLKASQKSAARAAHKDRKLAQKHYSQQLSAYSSSVSRLSANERLARFAVVRPLKHETSSAALAAAPRRLKALGGMLAGDFTSVSRPAMPPGGKGGLQPVLIEWVHPPRDAFRASTQERAVKRENERRVMEEVVGSIVKQREAREMNEDTYNILKRGDGAKLWGSDRTTLEQLPEGGISYAQLAHSVDKYS